jgi:hypothetical protein
MRGARWRADGFHEPRILGVPWVRSRVDILPLRVMSAEQPHQRRRSIFPRPLHPAIRQPFRPPATSLLDMPGPVNQAPWMQLGNEDA